MNNTNDQIRERVLKIENMFSPFACKSVDAIRLNPQDNDIRLEFARDTDRILHTLTYTRYIDKTQVYSDELNDNISRRMTHVQFVSKTSRTIARALGLNEDLCEAISLGHDIGHSPFGHVGEKILNDISKKELSKCFAHNLNSVRTLTDIENNGKGCNISLQVLDGIMCHNGEMVKDKYLPMQKDYDEFLREYNICQKDEKYIKNIRPMTLEGCVVRISDIIGYIGKDIEDAKRLGKINIESIPKSIVNTLGTTNKKIMNTIIMDIIENSFNKPYITMSNKIYEAVVSLKEFNMKNIYSKAITKEKLQEYTDIFNRLYKVFLNALYTEDVENDIYKVFLNNMCDEYKNNTRKEMIVIDYLSGMTDRYIEAQYKKYR